MYQYQFFIADRNGNILAEIEPQIKELSWVLSGIGKCVFSVSRIDPKFRRDYLDFGQRVYIEFDNGLPPWGGVIDPPRTWETGKVEFTAYSAEYLLSFRATDKGRYFDSASAGLIFQNLVAEANAVGDLGILQGDIWLGGATHSPEYHLKSVYSIVKDSLTKRLSSADFWIEPVLEDGKIKFYAHLFERRGYDKPDVQLIEGHNISLPTFREQGPIYNDYTIAGSGGEGDGWGADRLISQADSNTSISLYGLRNGVAVFNGVVNQNTLDTHAKTLKDAYSAPRVSLGLEVTNQKPAFFSAYDLGDKVAVVMPNYGWEGYDEIVKVVGRTVIPGFELCKLALEV